MPSSLIRASAPMAISLRDWEWRETKRGGATRPSAARAHRVVVDADEKERGPIRVGPPHDGVHVERLTLGRTEAQARIAADGELCLEAHLGAHGAQVHGVPLEAATAGLDGDGP